MRLSAMAWILLGAVLWEHGRPAPAGPVPTTADAIGAVSGIKDGKYGFHTDREPNPWWQSDLGDVGVQGIERVVVYNRLDYGPGIANATKLAILTSADGRAWTERYRHDGSPIGGVPNNDPLVVRFTEPNVAARLVRIQLLSEAPIWHHLDGRGREIRRMRSWVSLKPGEVRSCTGCHEGQMTTPRAQTASLAAGRPAVAPSQRVSWGDKPASFHRDIRPILDRRCLGCHTGLKPSADVDVADPRIAQRLQSMAAISPAMAGAEVSPVRRFGSYAAPLFKVLSTQTHAESLELSEQEWIDLRAWVDLNAPLHDCCRIVCPSVQAPYRYTPAGDIALPPAGARAVGMELDREVVAPVFAARCAGCHEQPESVFRPHWVDLHAPANSLFLRAPLAEAHGGRERCGRAVFTDAQDPDFRKLLDSLHASAAAAWNHPDLALIPLVEAGRKPEWVTPGPETPLSE